VVYFRSTYRILHWQPLVDSRWGLPSVSQDAVVVMNQIHFTVPENIQNLARLGVPVTEWNVLTVVGDDFMGVIKSTDLGYVFIDVFGFDTSFEDAEDIHEVFAWVAKSLNPTVVN